MRPLQPAAPARAFSAWLALAAAGLAPAPALADSLRCDGGLVGLGDSKLDLLGKCGRPALAEQRTVERGGAVFDGDHGAVSQVAIVPVETWTYDFGPRRFVQHVTLEAGRVSAVERGGYGYEQAGGGMGQASIPRARCDHLAIHEGDRTFDLLARCGEPASRDVTVLRRQVAVLEPASPRPAPPPGGVPPRPGGGAREGGGRDGRDHARQAGDAPVLVQGPTATSTIEVWAYDFGPQVLVRLVELRDGVVTRVETGGHGYSR